MREKKIEEKNKEIDDFNIQKRNIEKELEENHQALDNFLVKKY